jgi:exopolysaccharide biosynthesis polyprenyl glycosylphosphotransferase
MIARRLGFRLFLIDLCLTVLSLYVASHLRLLIPLGRDVRPWLARLPWGVYALAAICWGGALILSSAYDSRRALRWYGELSRVTSGGILATIIMAGAVYFGYRQLSRLQFIYFFVLNLFVMLFYRGLLRVFPQILRMLRMEQFDRVLIVGAGDLGTEVAKVLHQHSRWGYRLVGFLDDDPAKQTITIAKRPVLGKLASISDVVGAEEIDEVWVALPLRSRRRLEALVAEVERMPVRVKVIPDYLSLALVQARTEVIGGIPLIGLRESVIGEGQRWIKRLFDIVVASLLLMLSLPAMVLIAIAIRFDSEGPIIFRQERVGENRRLFGMYKFRTMEQGAAQRQVDVIKVLPDGGIVHKSADDPRVTRVGSFLRRFSLDEFPQLINVLKGDMSLVGPRPEMPWLVDRYEPWQSKRFSVPQGITGWWQITGRSDKPMHLNTADDLYYVFNYSIWLDIWILLRTPLAVLRGRGAF